VKTHAAQTRIASLAILCLAIAGCGEPSYLGKPSSSTSSGTNYLTNAQNTHKYIVANLLTTYGSYEIEPGSTTSYAWYDGSQIYADAAMITVEGDATYAPYMNATYTWMGGLWDIQSATGGYWASAGVDGSNPGGSQYVDDNSLIGLAYLDAYAATAPGDQQNAYLYSAEAIANWLMQSGMWDSQFGGGFWWSTDKTLKPTQSNGLAMQLFLRLYQITGQSYYKSWAQSIDTWLESTMYDSTSGLYNWEIESNGTLETTRFTYDNAIMMEAFILDSTILNDSSYLTKAETLATNLNKVLYIPATGVYQFNTGDARVNPTWSGWVSEAMIRLYQADNNSSWLTYAKSNIDFINTYMLNPNTGAYYQYCNVDGTGVNSDIEGVDQAWMQRIQTLYAPYSSN
jgi:uncharacterized protein YyaL (SSP411 family)